MFNEEFMALEIILKCGCDFDFIYPLRINGEIKYKQNLMSTFHFFSLFFQNLNIDLFSDSFLK